MARITLPGFSRGIYAVGPLIFEDGVAEVEGDLPLVVERLAYALGASIDGGDPLPTDPGLEPQADPPASTEPTPAELWGVGDNATDGGSADSSVEEPPVIDYQAPTGGVPSQEAAPVSEPVVDAGNGTPVPGDSEAGDVEPGASSDLGTASGTPSDVVPSAPADAAPSEPQPTNPDGTLIPTPDEPDPATVDPSAVPPVDAAPADEVPSTEDSGSGKHAADVDDVEPVTSDATPAADTTTPDAPASGA